MQKNHDGELAGSDGFLTGDLRQDLPTPSAWRELIRFTVIVGAAWLFVRSPFKFLLNGFHVWIHELGHSTVAWLGGYKATPLPIGWTNISSEPSLFVTACVVFLLGSFAWVSWKERLFWPIPVVLLLVTAQGFMTFGMSPKRHDMLRAYSGVAGEFVLSAGFVIAYFLRFPEKFRWDICKYPFLFVGTTCFLGTFQLWQQVKAGYEDIPFGTMMHGSDDEGGDMNQLLQIGWSQRNIITSYCRLGWCCLASVGISVFIACAVAMRQWFAGRTQEDGIGPVGPAN